jgi:hypothetical protein
LPGPVHAALGLLSRERGFALLTQIRGCILSTWQRIRFTLCAAFLIGCYPNVLYAIYNGVPYSSQPKGGNVLSICLALEYVAYPMIWLPAKIGVLTHLWESPWSTIAHPDLSGSASPVLTYFRISNIYWWQDMIFSILVWFALFGLFTLPIHELIRRRKSATNTKQSQA